MSRSLQDFMTDAFNNGCVKFKTVAHVTPDGVVKIAFTGEGQYKTEADGIVVNDSVKLCENVHIGGDKDARDI